MEKLIPCKACGKEISSDAKTCPNCGAKNKHFPWWQVILALFLFSFIYGAISNKTTPTGPGNVNKGQIEEERNAPDLEVLQAKSVSNGYSKYIIGMVKNNTDKTYSYVQISFNLYDDSGAQVGSSIDNINNLEN